VGANIGQRNNHNYITHPSTVEASKQIIDHIFDPKAPSIAHLMKQYLFVVEADEYNRHFLHLDPDYALVTNIELDHADYYGDEETYFEAYRDFVRKVKYKIRMIKDSTGEQVLEEFPQLVLIPTQQFTFSHLLGSHNHGNASLALDVTKELLTKDSAIQGAEMLEQKSLDAKETITQFT